MAGGMWTSQNKIRPGAYINFEYQTSEDVSTGDRGIVTLAMNLSWGDTTKLIDVTMGELLSGKSLAKIGLISTDADALLPKLALQNARLLKIYRLNGAGTKATKILNSTVSYALTTDSTIDSSKTYYTRSGDPGAYVYTPVAEPVVADIGTYYEKTETVTLSATAKYGGTFGNKIAVAIVQTSIIDLFEVQTYANGYLVDTQKVSTAQQLVGNDFVDFEGNGTITAVASVLLSGGLDGTVTETNGYTSYFNVLKLNKWNTVAIPTQTAEVLAAAITFINTMRNNEGKYVQAVISNSEAADYEGIINNINGVVLNDGTDISAAQFTAWVAGATAGAQATESITGKIVTDAIEIKSLKSNDEIITGLNNGQFLLSYTQDGNVKVEKDINSLHTFTNKSYVFSKNRVIRELDEIGSSIEAIWETTYLGKVSNDSNGLALFKASIIDYLTGLQNKGAITDFNAQNVTVERGNDIDTIIASIAVKPLDSMEILYMTVNID